MSLPLEPFGSGAAVSRRRFTVGSAALLWSLSTHRGQTADVSEWANWRGPGGLGIADGCAPPTQWSQTAGVVWSADLPGWGTSSPVVRDGRVIVTSMDGEADRRSLQTLCYSLADGEEMWRHDFGFGFSQPTHQKTSLAMNTPIITSDAVYVSFGNAEFACYSLEGRLQWVKRLVEELGDPKTAWGWGTSLLLSGDHLIFNWDHHAGPCWMIGLARKTGEIAWKVDRPIGTSHSTPLRLQHHQQTDLLVPGKNRVTAFRAEDRKPLWVYGEGSGPYNGEIIVSPTAGDGMVFTQLWRQSPIHALRLMPDGQPPTTVWISDKPGPQEPSLLYYRGILYCLLDTGILVAYQGQTGKELYRERIAAECNSSPLAADGRIYVSDIRGKTVVLAAGPEPKILARNDLGERITSSPAVVAGRMLIRTDSSLWCLKG